MDKLPILRPLPNELDPESRTSGAIRYTHLGVLHGDEIVLLPTQRQCEMHIHLP